MWPPQSSLSSLVRSGRDYSDLCSSLEAVSSEGVLCACWGSSLTSASWLLTRSQPSPPVCAQHAHHPMCLLGFLDSAWFCGLLIFRPRLNGANLLRELLQAMSALDSSLRSCFFLPRKAASMHISHPAPWLSWLLPSMELLHGISGRCFGLKGWH